MLIARSRLRIDTRKWLASKLIPKIYGRMPDEWHGSSNLTPEEEAKLREEISQMRAKYIREY